MTAWVRYSVATYIGLLLAGALVVPQRNASADGGFEFGVPASAVAPCAEPRQQHCYLCNGPGPHVRHSLPTADGGMQVHLADPR